MKKQKQNQKYLWAAGGLVLCISVAALAALNMNSNTSSKLQGSAANVSPLAGHTLNLALPTTPAPTCTSNATNLTPGHAVTFSVTPVDPGFVSGLSSDYTIEYLWTGDGGLFDSPNHTNLSWTYASTGTYNTKVQQQLLYEPTGAIGPVVENSISINCPTVTIAPPTLAPPSPPPPAPPTAVLSYPVACSGSPSIVFPGDTVTWTAATSSSTPSGTTFSWSLPVAGSGQTVRSIAGASGTLTMGVTYSVPLFFGAITSTANCSVTVHAPTAIIGHNFAPVITSIYPTSGTTDGATFVQITGHNFDTLAVPATVNFGGTPAPDVIVNSSTSISVITPGNNNPGAVDVNFTDAKGGQSTLSGGFTYVASTPTPSPTPSPTPNPTPAPTPKPPSTPTPPPTPITISTDCTMFKDVKANDPDCAAIGYVNSIGAMTGNPNGTFGPNAFLQRDQVAKIILVAFKLYDTTTDYCGNGTIFPDIAAGNWAFQYICAAKAEGLITGYQNGPDAGHYIPSRNVSRIEFLAILLRSLGDQIPSNNSSSYDDVQAGQWFSGYASYAMNNSLFPGPNLNPNSFTMRRDVARILYQLYKEGKI